MGKEQEVKETRYAFAFWNSQEKKVWSISVWFNQKVFFEPQLDGRLVGLWH